MVILNLFSDKYYNVGANWDPLLQVICLVFSFSFFFLILFLVGFSPSFFFRFQFAFSFHFLISFVSSLLPNSILIWCALHISLYCELLSLQSIPITCCHLHSLTEPNSIVFTKEKIKRRVRNRYQELAFAVVVAYGLALACLSYLLAFLHELSVMPPILLVSPAYLLHPAGPPILPVFSPLLIAGSYPVSIGLWRPILPPNFSYLSVYIPGLLANRC